MQAVEQYMVHSLIYYAYNTRRVSVNISVQASIGIEAGWQTLPSSQLVGVWQVAVDFWAPLVRAVQDTRPGICDAGCGQRARKVSARAPSTKTRLCSLRRVDPAEGFLCLDSLACVSFTLLALYGWAKLPPGTLPAEAMQSIFWLKHKGAQVQCSERPLMLAPRRRCQQC